MYCTLDVVKYKKATMAACQPAHTPLLGARLVVSLDSLSTSGGAVIDASQAPRLPFIELCSYPLTEMLMWISLLFGVR